ncbi:hypothetical protein ACFTQL_09360 [Peribacillus butanolivorans]|uniref:hypothetical protein n=1 Tax=Peribacillus butanolivorans TaxID=421767 RepID=UPI0036293351
MDDYNKAILLYKKGFSLRQIEIETSLNRKKLSIYMKEIGLEVNNRVGNSGYDKYQVWEEAKQRWLTSGMKESIKQICKELHTTSGSFRKWLRDQGYEIKPKSTIRDVESENLKLQKALELRREGHTLHQISRLVKIDRTKLSDFLIDQGINSYEEMRISVDESIFEVIDTREKAYWLGFLYADGWVFYDYRYGVELALKTDDYRHLVKFKKFMKTEAKIKEKIIKLNEDFYRAYRISIFSKKIAGNLINLGCTPNKSLILKFPSEDTVPNKYILDFVRGYFDGDGSIYIPKSLKGQPTLSVVGTKDFLLGFRRILNLPNTKMVQKGQAFSTRHGGAKQVVRILDEIYGDAPVYLERKYQKYQKLINKMP